MKALFICGITLSSIGFCGIDSDGYLAYLFGAFAIIGMVIAIIGWRCEVERRKKRRMEEKARARRLAQTWACYLSSDLLAGRDNSDM